MKNYTKYFIVFGMILLLSSCLPGGGNNNILEPAGFFTGIWHGWIAPFSLIVGFFNESISIYEVNNTGWWYDFGYYMAIISGFGGLQFFRNSKKK